MRVGQYLTMLRKSRKLSQAALGKEIGVNPSTVCFYETGASPLGLGRAQKIANALNLSDDERERLFALTQLEQGIDFPISTSRVNERAIQVSKDDASDARIKADEIYEEIKNYPIADRDRAKKIIIGVLRRPKLLKVVEGFFKLYDDLQS